MESVITISCFDTDYEVVIGSVVASVGDPAALRSVVEGCNKIIYCATARSLVTFDLNRVDHQGVYNLSKGFQDEVTTKYDGGMDAKFEFRESGDVVFSGYVFTRGMRTLASTVKSSLPTSGMKVRVPLSSFQPVNPADPPLDPFLIHTFTIHFEPRRQFMAKCFGSGLWRNCYGLSVGQPVPRMCSGSGLWRNCCGLSVGQPVPRLYTMSVLTLEETIRRLQEAHAQMRSRFERD
nr:hypothetical protein [Tanacetum cinerariifolium]